jgi:hypothetical protein
LDSVGLARIGGLAAFALVATAADARAQATADPTPTFDLIADRDDDDANGVPDGEQELLPLSARADLVPLAAAWTGTRWSPPAGTTCVRILAQGRPVAWDTPLPAGAALQGHAVCNVEIAVRRRDETRTVRVGVAAVTFRDGRGLDVDPTRDHASLARTPPDRVDPSPDARFDDPDALRVLVVAPATAPAGDLLKSATIDSYSASGVLLDSLVHVDLAPASCPALPQGAHCAATMPIRFVMDDVDRTHPLVQNRSVRAEVGGWLSVRAGHAAVKSQAIRVLGPRQSPLGPIGRLRATLRPFVTRMVAGGAPVIGDTDAGAIAALRAELALASAIWGQCGVTCGPPRDLDVRLMDPPPPHLLAIGDDSGLPASGGTVQFRAGGKRIVVPVARGARPDRVADDIALAVERSGLSAVVSPNARTASTAAASVDVSVRRPNGALLAIDLVKQGEPLTDDATLSVRVGSVDLADGLSHFNDVDSVAGTLEERTLLKAIDDGDPRTIEIVVVPFFEGGGRIGESFIASDLSSLRNFVLVDRAGIRARRSSLTLAHELGHVLMDVPGHPDDYGVDTPTLLMDSDASDASPFGPRRLTVEECARVVLQSGPHARAPLLADWPLGPIAPARTGAAR